MQFKRCYKLIEVFQEEKIVNPLLNTIYVSVENDEIYRPPKYGICKVKTSTKITKQCARISRLNCEHLWCDMICKCCELSLKNGKSCSCHLSNNLLTHVINLVNIPRTQHIAIKQYLKESMNNYATSNQRFT
jgi:hypothetical protein